MVFCTSATRYSIQVFPERLLLFTRYSFSSYNVLEFSAKGTLRHVFHNITSLVAGCWESTPLSQQLLVSTYVPTE